MYVVWAYDAKGNALDIDPREQGYGLTTDALGAVSAYRTVRSGLLHDFDNGTATRKRIAYFRVECFGRVGALEIVITPWGRKCHLTADKVARRPDAGARVIHV